jgi:hypothetical protein
MSTYTVNFWGSVPGTNDDCWSGLDFDSRDEALAFYHSDTFPGMAPHSICGWVWVEIDGPDLHEERKNPTAKRDREASYDRTEYAMQAGMMGGCVAYNEAMGWDVE